jgi:hypothetical protein
MTQHTEQAIKPCEFANGACIHCEATEQGDCEGYVCNDSLYASYTKREWVGLEAEEILDLFDRNNVYGSKWIEFARTVEAKLKAKNDH